VLEKLVYEETVEGFPQLCVILRYCTAGVEMWGESPV